MSNKGKHARRERVLAYLNNCLTTIKQAEIVDAAKLKRVEFELARISFYLGGGKKNKRKIVVNGEVVQGDRWYIDIYRISYAKVKRSERRKNKGKSRKKLRTVKTLSFVKSVVLQPGMLSNFREGRMGISPREHTFRTRKDEPQYL